VAKAKARSQVLVIDASVARAAGDVSQHPTSRYCREFLQAVLQLCHRMAFTGPIQEEWNRHQSRFARQWRTSMMARKKIDPVVVPSGFLLEKRIKRSVRDSTVVAIIEKDLRLIEAAIVTDKRVISLDEQVRRHLQAHRSELPEVCSVCWVNPNNLDEEVLAWLEHGAPIERSRMLGYTPSEPNT
jgi:hypothetical protein